MGSIYAQNGSSGGSVYAQSGSTSGSAPAPAKKGGGILDALKHVVEQGGSDLFDIAKNTAAGVVDMAKAPVLDTYDAFASGFDPKKAGQHSTAFLKAQAEGVKQVAEHPLRHPGYTALDALAALGAGGSLAARAGAASDAAAAGGQAGDVARAFAKKPQPKPRLFQVGNETVNLHPSASPTVRAAQEAHDTVVRNAIANNPTGRVASYGFKRLGNSLSETRRYQTAMRAAPAEQIARQGSKLPRPQKQAMQDALRLTSEQTTPAEAIATAKREIAAGHQVETNQAWLQRLQNVHDGGYVNLDPGRPAGAQVHIDEQRYPDLAALDKKVAAGALSRDAALAKVGELNPEQLRARINEPNLVHAGATYEKPTPGKLGVPSQALLRARSRVDRLQALVDRAEPRQRGDNLLPLHLGGAGDSPTVARLKSGLSVARDELQQLEQAAAARQRPTGLVGATGETRPGRNFVSYALTEPNGATAVPARSIGPVVGGVRNIVPKQAFTGEGLRAGLVPQDTTGIVARGMLRAYRRLDTENFRARLARMGSETKQTPNDVLVNTQEIKSAPISDIDKALLGQKRLNFNEEVGHAANFHDWLTEAIPGHRDKFAADKAHPIGATAPEGYTWVPKGLLGDLAHTPPNHDPGMLVRRLNDANAAVTAATVYLKPGHIATRAGTNAVANMIQGSATPAGIGESVRLWKALSDDDKARALAAAGQGGFAALPHEGSSMSAVPRLIQGGATKGAQWWARHADAPFRFNSIAYEARKAGFDTPAKFRTFLDQLESPDGLNAAQRAKIDWVARRANREQIAYDRLNEFEKRVMTRLFWFYPWTAASVRFAGNTLLEHPVKAAVVGNAAQLAAKQQASDLGPLPTYARGLFKIGGPAATPTVVDWSTMNPFSTPADVGSIAGHLFTSPKSSAELASGLFNPVVGALGEAAYGLNQYGSAAKGSPIGNFAKSLVSATPESGLYTDVAGNQAKRMYPTPGLLAALEHFLTKPGGPRKLNRAVANQIAAKEASGRGR